MSGQDILQELRQAVFRVTENGESMYFSVPESVELLQAAAHLQNYLSDKNADTKFTAIFPHGEKITQEQFDAAAAERMENTGCIAGAYELDLDARTFSALNIMDGWKVYAMQNVADAARQAYQEAEMSEDDRWRIFLDRLDGQELTTPSILRQYRRPKPPAQQGIGNGLDTDTFLPIVQSDTVSVDVVTALMHQPPHSAVLAVIHDGDRFRLIVLHK